MICLEDSRKHGTLNLGYQSDNIEAENQITTCCETEVEMSKRVEVQNKEETFCEEQNGLERLGDGDTIGVTCDSELSMSYEKRSPRKIAESLKQTANGRKDSILELRDGPEANADSINFVTCETDTSHSTAKKKPMMAKDWLVNPHLYKVSLVK